MFIWSCIRKQKCKVYLSINYFQFQTQTDWTKFTITFISRKIRKKAEMIMQTKASIFIQNPIVMRLMFHKHLVFFLKSPGKHFYILLLLRLAQICLHLGKHLPHFCVFVTIRYCLSNPLK